MSSSSPALSVLLPFYNAEETLAETLDSIEAQSFTRFEVVAVDDGCTDGSAEIVARRAKSDPRLRLLQPGRQGVVGAMNTALAHARAPLVARMDADDIMHPDRLSLQLQHLQEDPELTLVGTRVELFPPELVQGGFAEYVRWQNSCVAPEAIAEEIYVELPIAHPTVMFRREAVMEAGGYRDGPFPEDYELILRLHARGHRMAKVPQVLLKWRESPGRLTRTDPRYAREAFDKLRAAYLVQDPRLSPHRLLAIWGAGRKTRRRTKWLLEQGCRPDAWIDIDPRKIGNVVQGAPVVAPGWLCREPRPFVLSYVANHGAREEIAGQLEEMGYRRGGDYLMVG